MNVSCVLAASWNFRFHIKIFSALVLWQNDKDIHRHTSTCLVVRSSLGVLLINDLPPALPTTLQLAALFPCQARRCAARSRAERLSPHIEFQRGSSRVSLSGRSGFTPRPLPLPPSPLSCSAHHCSPPFCSFRPQSRTFDWKFSAAVLRCAPGQSEAWSGVRRNTADQQGGKGQKGEGNKTFTLNRSSERRQR